MGKWSVSFFVLLSKPVLATVAVFAFLFSWNDYLGPLLSSAPPARFWS